ncbi:dnaJ homolog subfamily C member 24-like isoform X2 [Lycorma delicatula]|uniref:dnaJ homolog subfamily C member 24-like isoform X2 n=1 Tax=Lycorma delicatula TaxID=130591 RepID=UPI003F517732
MKNLYEILQCTIDSSDEEIRKKYQQLILEYHPDKCSNENDRNKFIEIDKAWKILRDKESREVYNAQLKMDSVNKPLLYGTYKLNELLKSDNGYFYCKCRCGGSYCVDENDLDDVMDKCFVECDECSLAICISIGNKSNKGKKTGCAFIHRSKEYI